MQDAGLFSARSGEIKAEIGYYGHLFAMLIISGLQSKSIIDLASTSILHKLIFQHAIPPSQF